jgi:hypothetical protein
MCPSARRSSGQHVEHLVGDLQHRRHVEGTAGAARQRRERLALQQLHHDERRAVLGGVDVPHLDRPAVPEAIDDARLLFETCAQLGRTRQGRVQDFDRIEAADLVARHVDARHAALAEQLLERPLATQGGADARGCADREPSSGLCFRHRTPIVTPTRSSVNGDGV